MDNWFRVYNNHIARTALGPQVIADFLNLFCVSLYVKSLVKQFSIEVVKVITDKIKLNSIVPVTTVSSSVLLIIAK